jgi:hypothetical protein
MQTYPDGGGCVVREDHAGAARRVRMRMDVLAHAARPGYRETLCVSRVSASGPQCSRAPLKLRPRCSCSSGNSNGAQTRFVRTIYSFTPHSVFASSSGMNIILPFHTPSSHGAHWTSRPQSNITPHRRAFTSPCSWSVGSRWAECIESRPNLGGCSTGRLWAVCQSNVNVSDTRPRGVKSTKCITSATDRSRLLSQLEIILCLDVRQSL